MELFCMCVGIIKYRYVPAIFHRTLSIEICMNVQQWQLKQKADGGPLSSTILDFYNGVKQHIHRNDPPRSETQQDQ